MTETTSSASTANPRRWQVLGLLAVAQFMLILDITVVTVAMPEMGTDLGLDRESLTWVMSAYTLAFGGLMLLGGRAADILGPRPVVLAGLGLFTLASLVVGLASSGDLVISGRVAQGVGAALMSPAALSVVVRLFDGEERNKALGIWSSLGGVGAAVGVLLGGILTAGPGWEWVFFVNVPIGVVLLVGLHQLLPELPAWGAGARLDVVGATLVTAATLLVIYAFIGAPEQGWGSATTLGLLAVGVATYAALALWLSRASSPLVDPKLLTRRPVVAGTFVLFVTTALMVAVFFLGTFYLQQSEGHGPLATGLLFLPVALATMAGAQLGGRLLGRIGARRLGVAGLLVAAAGLATPAVTISTVSTVVAVSIGSAGLGALFVVAAATALGQVAPEEAGIASGVLSTSHELGSSLGAAVVSGVVAGSLVAGSDTGFERGYLVAALVAAAAAVLAGVLIPGAAAMTATLEQTKGRQVWLFTRHYLEMVAAMLLGMVTLYPLWLLATDGAADGSWVHRTEVELLAMATAMTVPMVLWMRHRGHGPRPTIEMAVAMYAGFVVVFPFLWVGWLDEMGVMMTGHVLMPLFMLGAMLWRREEYVCH